MEAKIRESKREREREREGSEVAVLLVFMMGEGVLGQGQQWI
jgi:hypothetical protein